MSINTKSLNHAQEFDALCDDAKSRIQEVDIDDVRAMQNGGILFRLIDVRDKDEFDQYHIEKSEFLSKGWAEAKIHTIVESKDEKIVLYCGGGNRSALVADNLQKMGYSNVLSMTGGIKAWVNAGHPVLKA